MARTIRSLLKHAVKDKFLHQLVDFPTTLNNTLDLLLTNIPDKIINIHDSRTLFMSSPLNHVFVDDDVSASSLTMM